MKESKRDVENAVLTLARYMDIGKNYEEVIDFSAATLPRIVEMISYDLFLREIYAPNITDDKVYEAIRTVIGYCKELNRNGFVEFNK